MWATETASGTSASPGLSLSRRPAKTTWTSRTRTRRRARRRVRATARPSAWPPPRCAATRAWSSPPTGCWAANRWSRPPGTAPPTCTTWRRRSSSTRSPAMTRS
ncbi:hypothetical protein EYF80_059779 [Liparis tanakae]|uniref:Uncharacterized protein n=1 Tax=Liparis tanakae TaxID=230148 RepID=A0A4Z2ENC0_9TELE|nr:hypothetical protein EYF80_059779 [Liparis tanakae]